MSLPYSCGTIQCVESSSADVRRELQNNRGDLGGDSPSSSPEIKIKKKFVPFPTLLLLVQPIGGQYYRGHANRVPARGQSWYIPCLIRGAVKRFSPPPPPPFVWLEDSIEPEGH